jgi:hypothetical protein
MKSILLSLGLLGCTMSQAIYSNPQLPNPSIGLSGPSPVDLQLFQNLSNGKPSICPLQYTTEKIVNGDFSKTTCTDAVCAWNKSNYKNNVEGW